MPKPAKRRVAIYARVSTQDQDPQMQLRELRTYAKLRAFTIAHEFIDHVSGATSVRPELSQLWQTARARKIDTILVWKFDRFARSTKQLIDALEEFRHLGVDFISITEQIDTSSRWVRPCSPSSRRSPNLSGRSSPNACARASPKPELRAHATADRSWMSGSSKRFSVTGAPARACTRSRSSWASPIRPSRSMDHHGRPGSSHDEA